jgi:hypothetical protein
VAERDLDLASGHRPTDLHLALDEVDEVRALRENPPHRSPGAVRGAAHPVVEQGPRLGWDEARLMGPVLHEPPRRPVASPVEDRAVVRTEAREEGEVVAARQHVDAVDLHDAHPVDDALDVTHGGSEGLRARVEQALGCDRDATCLGKGEPTDRAGGHGAVHSPGSMSR